MQWQEKKQLLDDLYHHIGFKVESKKNEFAIEIERLMDHAGVSNAELARRLDCSKSYITKLLCGDCNLTIESMVKIADALDASVDFHMTKKGEHWVHVIDGGSSRQKPAVSTREWIRNVERGLAA